MSGIDRDRLRELIKERGMTPRSLSRDVGDNPYLVRDILSGKSLNPRSDTLAKLAEKLGVLSENLLIGDPAQSIFSEAGAVYEQRRKQIVPRFLPVRYRVQAGNWVEIDADEPPVQITHPVAPDARYSNWPQWLELVVGDSVNMKIQPGHYAHVVDAIEMGYAPKHGDWVVVERRRGATRERTIKQVELARDGAVSLHPRSTNPRWSDRVVLNAGVNDGEDIEVEIVGKVIGSYDPDFG